MPAFALKNCFARWREWELNPVVVKELRQSVRSWAVSGTLLVFLAVMFFTALGFLVHQSLQRGLDPQLGARVFQSFVVILTMASVTFIPIYVGMRLAGERQEGNLDLLYVSTLTPDRIIRGKFFCGAYMAVLFFSACMPFMVFTNLLRGVDLPTIFLILLGLFLVVCAAVQAAIFLACLPVSKRFKVLLSVFAIMGLYSIITPLVAMLLAMMRFGVGSMIFSGRSFWPGFLTATAVLLGATVLLYFLSVALISPPSANRALRLRLCLTALWLLGALVSGLWIARQHEARLVLPWATCSFVALIAALAVVISNRDDLSARVRRTIPPRPAARALAFLFYNGAAGGLVWATALLGATFAAAVAVLGWTAGRPGFSTMSRTDLADFQITIGAVLLYAMAYALTALILHRQFFRRRSPRLPGILAVLLPGVLALAPYIVFFFLNRLSWRSLERFEPGNVFNVFAVRDDADKVAHLAIAAAWVIVMIVFNARWFVRQVINFQPLKPRPTPPQLADQPAPLPTAVN